MTVPTLPLGRTQQINGAYWLALPWLDLKDLPSPNKRQHWALSNRQTQNIIDTVRWLTRQAKLGTHAHAEVELHYLPATNRRLDADNLILILKAACDALVHEHLVPDDTPQWMTKHMPLIHPKTAVPPGHARLLLRISTSNTASEH